MPKKTVNITLKQEADMTYFTYDKPSLRTKRNDPIEWFSDYPFSIQFLLRTPLDKVIIQSEPDPGGNYKATGTIRADAEPGTFFYFVSAAVVASADFYTEAGAAPDTEAVLNEHERKYDLKNDKHWKNLKADVQGNKDKDALKRIKDIVKVHADACPDVIVEL